MAVNSTATRFFKKTRPAIKPVINRLVQGKDRSSGPIAYLAG